MKIDGRDLGISIASFILLAICTSAIFVQVLVQKDLAYEVMLGAFSILFLVLGIIELDNAIGGK